MEEFRNEYSKYSQELLELEQSLPYIKNEAEFQVTKKKFGDLEKKRLALREKFKEQYNIFKQIQNTETQYKILGDELSSLWLYGETFNTAYMKHYNLVSDLYDAISQLKRNTKLGAEEKKKQFSELDQKLQGSISREIDRLREKFKNKYKNYDLIKSVESTRNDSISNIRNIFEGKSTPTPTPTPTDSPEPVSMSKPPTVINWNREKQERRPSFINRLRGFNPLMKGRTRSFGGKRNKTRRR